MANSGWTSDPTNVILPPGAVPPQTFIYIGDAAGDPYGALTTAGLDEGLVLYFGTLPYAYVLGIYQEFNADGSVVNDGHLYLAGVDKTAPPTHEKVFRLLETDWYPASADPGGVGNNYYEIADFDTSVFLDGYSLAINTSPDNIYMTGNPYIFLGAEALEIPSINPIAYVYNVLQIDGNEVGKGIWMSTGSTSSSAAIGTTETVVLTLPSKTYKANRAYRCYLNAAVSANTAGALAFSRLAKGAVGGQALGEFSRVPVTSAAAVFAQKGFIEFTCGPADVTTTLVVTLFANTGTVTQAAGATFPRTCTVEDIGNSGQLSSAAIALV